MDIKLVYETGIGLIGLHEMKDGEIAEIISWGRTDNRHIGSVVQRYGDSLVCIGKPKGCGWSCIFSARDVDRSDAVQLRLRILPPGTKLVIE